MSSCFVSLILSLALIFNCTLAFSQEQASPVEVNVMAPLKIKNWDTFKTNLQRMKAIGVKGVSIDVWWGMVQADGPNQFDWQYYDKAFQYIKDAGLQIKPIMSFHQCGANVGDDVYIPLPSWVWKESSDPQANMQYEDSNGDYSKEVVAVWADDLVKADYINFMKAFAKHFEAYASDFQDVEIGTGPAGELRYPSYDSKAWSYPQPGFLEGYSKVAETSFRDAMLKKYNDLSGVNQAWQTNYTSSSQILPPSKDFFSGEHYTNTQYGKDYVNWYNSNIVTHGKDMLEYAFAAFNTPDFQKVPLLIKVPGVHWQIKNPDIPRAAEVAAGLIDSHTEPTDAEGYLPIVKMIQEESANNHHAVYLDFTCLEMLNNYSAPDYSAATDLTFWMSTLAYNNNVTIVGENALASNLYNQSGWDELGNVFSYGHYQGLTLLRMSDVSDGFPYQKLINFISCFNTHK